MNTSIAIKNFIIIFAGCFLLALASQVSISLSFTEVPITGQTFAVLLISGFLGRNKGTLVIVLYLILAILGLPILAKGKSGLDTVVGVTGGYLFGFLVAVAITGHLFDKGYGASFPRMVLLFSLATVIILAFGLLWLGYHLEWKNVLVFGFYPFLWGAIIKIFLAAIALFALQKTALYKFIYNNQVK